MLQALADPHLFDAVICAAMMIVSGVIIAALAVMAYRRIAGACPELDGATD
jgi:hypothetical protein